MNSCERIHGNAVVVTVTARTVVIYPGRSYSFPSRARINHIFFVTIDYITHAHTRGLARGESQGGKGGNSFRLRPVILLRA